MKKLIFLGFVLMLCSHICFASPLEDFSQGRTAIDLSWKPVTFEGSNVFDFSVSTGLGNNWAVNYRQINYDTSYEALDYSAKNRELNLIYKVNENVQLYTGYSKTTGYNKTVGEDSQDKNVIQVGAIATKKLSDRMTLYTILGGGINVANVEFGLSYQICPVIEITSTYRHLSVEKIGPSKVKENFRGFGMGVTYKM